MIGTPVCRRVRRGFTLVEILISVAIMAVLLMATAAALQASIDSFSANQAAADTLQRGRIAMMRMSAQLRAGTDHLPSTASKQTSFIGGAAVTDTGVRFLNDADETILYRLDPTSGDLTVTVNGGTARTLASHVESFTVKLMPTRSATSIKTGGVYDEVERLTLTLALRPFVDGAELQGQSTTLSETVTPRARLWN